MTPSNPSGGLGAPTHIFSPVRNSCHLSSFGKLNLGFVKKIAFQRHLGKWKCKKVISHFAKANLTVV